MRRSADRRVGTSSTKRGIVAAVPEQRVRSAATGRGERRGEQEFIHGERGRLTSRSEIDAAPEYLDPPAMKKSPIAALITGVICALAVVAIAGLGLSHLGGWIREATRPFTIDDFRWDGKHHWDDVARKVTAAEIAGEYLDTGFDGNLDSASPRGFVEVISLREDGTYDDVAVPSEAPRRHETGTWRFHDEDPTTCVAIILHASRESAEPDARIRFDTFMNLEESSAGYRLRRWFDGDNHAYYTRRPK
jgi:hypothetical protein